VFSYLSNGEDAMARKRKGRKAVAKRSIKRRRVAKAKRGTRKAGVGGALSGLKTYRTQLVARRNELDAQIQAVDGALRVMGVAVTARRPAGRVAGRIIRRRPAGKGGRRGPRAGSLKEHILGVLAGRGVMSVKDITEGVLAGGYRTKNKTLAKSVGIALTELPNVSKVARGRFRAR
jgi:hypothetical protein